MPKVIPAVCNECKGVTSVYSISGDAMYTIPNCNHHGNIVEIKRIKKK